jgi:hypothetical protein
MPFDPMKTPTPFGVFDADVQFQHDADAMVDFVRRKLGAPVMKAHIYENQVYASFEEASLEYSAIVNSYQAKSVLTTFLGAPTGSLQGSENKYVIQNLEFENQMAEPYGDAGPFTVNTSTKMYSASIDLSIGQQKYDLDALLATHSSGSGRIVIKKVFHFSPVSAYRFFGTTSGLNYLNNQFGFESYTPETIFYLLPIWEDILRGMQFKSSNNVRRSNYSYEINNNVLTLYPPPTNNIPLWIEWCYPSDPTKPTVISSVSGSTVENPRYSGVSNLSNIPFGNIVYSNLNSISKTWIRNMTFAYAKEIEGQIRSKMATIPIPNGDLTLNGPELIADARTTQDRLREDLKAMLDSMTYDKLATIEAEKATALAEVIKNVPLGIYIGAIPVIIIGQFLLDMLNKHGATIVS